MSFQGSALPRVRYVYLAQDASDVLRMGGVPLNVYNTFQSAYDAANALQLALDISSPLTAPNKVVIKVGNITSSASGDMTPYTDSTHTTQTNWNINVSISGINSTVSQLGNIDASNSTGNTCSVQVNASNVKIGDINTSGLTGTGDAGAVTILLASDLRIGNIIANGGTASVGSFGGFVTLSANEIGGILVEGDITSTGNGANGGTGGNINLRFITGFSTKTYSTIGGSNASVGTFTSFYCTGGFNVVFTKNGPAGRTGLDKIIITNSHVGTVTTTNNSTQDFAGDQIIDSRISEYKRVATNTGGWQNDITNSSQGGTLLQNNVFAGSAAKGIDFSATGNAKNLIGSVIMVKNICSVEGTNPSPYFPCNISIVHNGISGSMSEPAGGGQTVVGLLMTDNDVYNDIKITYGNAVTSPIPYRWTRVFCETLTLSATGANPMNTYELIDCNVTGKLLSLNTSAVVLNGNKIFNIIGGYFRNFQNNTGTFNLNASNAMIGNISRLDTGNIEQCTLGVRSDGVLFTNCITNVDGDNITLSNCTLRSSGASLDALAPQNVNVASDAASNFLSFFLVAPTANVTRVALLSA